MKFYFLSLIHISIWLKYDTKKSGVKAQKSYQMKSSQVSETTLSELAKQQSLGLSSLTAASPDAGKFLERVFGFDVNWL
ncbi:hypothetical protein H6G36_05310 [Anabaena minutissima FACHB-250]|nr:hypothetical protein [Anabaena minutissima FACHB-250]